MSEIHNPTIIGDMVLTQEPTLPEHAVRLQDLQQVAEEVAASRSLVVTDVTPTAEGNIGNKTYVPTLPLNSVVASVVADTGNVRVHFMTEGSMYRAPDVTINGEAPTFMESTNPTTFTGYSDLVLTETSTVTVTSGAAVTTVEVILATEGPVVDMLVIGALPGTQTAAKNKDVVQFTAIAGNEAATIEVVDLGAGAVIKTFVLGDEDSGGVGFRSVTGTFEASARSGQQALTVLAVNALGTKGVPVISNNAIELDQTVPAITPPSVTYPEGQNAVKIGDAATVTANVTEADVVEYTSSTDISVESPSTYEQVKTVTCMAGTYSEANNYTITATRTSNGARTVRHAAVQVSAVAVTIGVTTPQARLRVSESGVTHTFQLSLNQKILGNTTVTTTHGTITQQPTVANGQVLHIRLTDTDIADATETLTITVTAQGRSGMPAEKVAEFAVGGFEMRTLIFAPFSQTAPIGVTVRDISKVRVRYSGSESLLALRGDVAEATASFTIVDDSTNYAVKGGNLFLSDAAFAGSNTLGTLAVEIEEIV